MTIVFFVLGTLGSLFALTLFMLRRVLIVKFPDY